MTADKIHTKELFRSLDETTSEFLGLASSFNEREMNTAPNKGSWTAAQVAEHVTLSNIDITKELSKPGNICEREPDAGVENIKSIFLNFTKKLNSPDFILPTRDIYQRERLIKDLETSVADLERVSKKEDLFEIIDHAIFGEVTRLETLYFVIYHTQRHIHQLRKIHDRLKNRSGQPA